MKLSLPLLLLLVAGQEKEENAAARLKRGGWAEVRAIVARGASAGLEEASRSGDADVSFYAKAALGELAGPPLARTKGINGPATDAVAALFAMIEVPFSGEELPETRLAIPDGLTFLEALEWAGAKLDVEFIAGERGRWVTGARVSKGPRFAFGRIRAQLDGLRETKTYTTDQAVVSTVRLHGVLRAEPTLRLVGCRPALTLMEGTDDGGAALKAMAPGVQGWLRMGAAPLDPAVPFSITLGGHGAGATKLTRVRLAAEITIEKKRETFTFEKILDAKGARKVNGIVTATITDAGMEGEEAAIDLEIAATSEVDVPEWGTIELTDARGGRYASGGSSSGDGKTTKFRLRYQKVGELGPPDALTFTMTTETERRTVYLEFRDIPLN